MAEKIQIPIDVSSALNSLEQLNKALGQLTIPTDLAKSLTKQVENLTNDLTEYREKYGSSFDNSQIKNVVSDTKELSKQFNALENSLNKVGKLSKKALSGLIPADVKEKLENARNLLNNTKNTINEERKTINSLEKEQKKLTAATAAYNAQLESLNKKEKVGAKEYAVYNQEIKEAESNLKKLKTARDEAASSSEKEFNDASKAVDEAQKVVDNLKAAQENRITDKARNTQTKQIREEMAKLDEQYKKTATSISSHNKNIDASVQNLAQKIKQAFGIDLNLDENNPIESISDALEKVPANIIDDIRQKNEQLAPALKQVGQAATQVGNGFDQVSQQSKELDRQLADIEGVKRRITQFFAVGNAIQLVKRAIRSAFNSVKELDAIMTETAVVTDFDISDMWAQLPQYTKRANELGVTIADAYKSATLFYQQGLKTNEVIGVSNQTLKMARIAGLNATEATDKMTAALRGFNMEVNETNAERISDVYSKLAAITASNVKEISTAMTKTASLASNAGMQFETTAAFLSQIIETTRESAETAGTALKTVIARFQELKKDPSLIEDVDGEAVDANKIETALKSVGVALRDSAGQFRDLDQVFLDLAERWDTLSTNTQRYIATIAAGSRQQSRFIAMMSDYARTQQLVGAANTAAGASSQQYEKTLDSLQTKLNQLKNGFTEFTLSIGDNKLIKGAVDLLKGFIGGINKLTSSLPGPLNMFSKIGVAIGGFKIGKHLVDGFLKEFIKLKKEGVGPVSSLMPSITAGFKDLGNSVKRIFTTTTKVTNGALGSFMELKNSQGENYKMFTSNTKAALEWAKANNVSSEQMAAFNRAVKAGLPVEEAQLLLHNQTAAAKVMEADATKKESLEEVINTEVTEKSALAKMKERVANLLDTVAVKLHIKAVNADTKGIQSNTGARLAALGVILLVVAAVTALVASIAALAYNAWYNSITQQIKRIEKATKEASDAVKDANDRFTELADKKEELKTLEEELDNLTKGSDAWNKKLAEINSTVLELVENFPQLQKYVTIGKNGELTISEEGYTKVLQDQKQAITNAQQALAHSEATKQGLYQERARREASSILQNAGYAYQINMSYQDGQKQYQDVVSNLQAFAQRKGTSISSIMGSGDQTLLKEFVREFYNISDGMEYAANQYIKVLQDNKDALLEYEKALNEGEQAQRQAGKTAMATALASNTSQYRNAIIESYGAYQASDEYKQMIDTTTKEYSRESDYEDQENIKELMSDYGVISTGDDETDLAKLYIAMKGLADTEDNIEKYAELGEKELLQEIIAMEKGTKSLDAMTKAVSKLDLMTEKGQRDQAQSYAAILSGSAGSIGVGGNIKADAKTMAAALGLTEDELYNYIGTTAEEFATVVANLNKEAERQTEKVKTSFTNIGIEIGDSLNNLSIDTANALQNQLAKVFYATGQSKEVFDAIQQLAESVDKDMRDAFYQVMISTDFTDQDALDNLQKSLDSAGVKVNDLSGFLDKVANSANAMYKLDFEGLQKRIQNVGTAIKEILEGGSRTISTDLYNQLLPSVRSQFVEGLDGTYTYIGKSISELTSILYDTVNQSISDRLRQTNGQLALTRYAQKWNTTEHGKINWASGEGDALRAWDELYVRYSEYFKDLGWDYESIRGDENKIREILAEITTGNVELLQSEQEQIRTNSLAKKGELNYAAAANELYSSVLTDIEDAKTVGKGFENAIIRANIPEWIIQNFSDALDGGTQEEIQKALGEALIEMSKATAKGVMNNLQSMYDDNDIEGIMTMFGIVGGNPEQYREAVAQMLGGNKAGYNALLAAGNYETAAQNGLVGTLLGKNGVQYVDNFENLLIYSEKLSQEFDNLGYLTNIYTKALNEYNQANSDLLETLENGEYKLGRYGEYANARDSALGTLQSAQGTIRDNIANIMGQITDEAVKNAIHFDYESGTAYYDNTGLNDTQRYEAIKVIESIGEDISKMADINKNIKSIKDSNKQTLDKLKEIQTNFKQQLYDAIVNQYETEIQRQEDIKDAIDKANSNIVSSIQKAVSDQRQQRQNEQAEQEIKDKQERLAYLRMDSAANANEIAQLEKELYDAQLSYSDSLVDQEISKLQDANEKAQQQRADQIEIARQQLEWLQKTGKIWEEVAKLNNYDQMLTMARNAAGYEGMSAEQKADFDKQFWSSYQINNDKFDQGKIKTTLPFVGPDGKEYVIQIDTSGNVNVEPQDVGGSVDSDIITDENKAETDMRTILTQDYYNAQKQLSDIEEQMKQIESNRNPFNWLESMRQLQDLTQRRESALQSVRTAENNLNNYNTEAMVQFFIDGAQDAKAVADEVLDKIKSVLTFRQNTEINPQ